MSSPARASFPNPDDSRQAYFFKDDKYAVIQWAPGTTDDTIVTGPKSVVDYWPALKEAGFATVDAVLPNPDNKGQAYFFSGENYALIEINPGAFSFRWIAVQHPPPPPSHVPWHR